MNCTANCIGSSNRSEMAADIMVTIWGAVLVVILWILPMAIRRMAFIRKVDSFPGPPAYPLVGNMLPFMHLRREQYTEALHEIVKQHSPIFRTWVGTRAEVHLTQPEHVQVILDSMKYVDKSYMYNFLHPWLGTGLLTSSGQKWHLRRKMITPTFHFKILKDFFDVFVEKSEILVQKLQDQTEKEFDIYPYIGRCALDIICETAMGTQVNTQDDSASDYVTAVANGLEYTIRRKISPWLHSDLIFWRTEMGKSYKACLGKLHGFTLRVIRERREALSHSSPQNTIDADGTKKRLTFLDLLLSAEGGAKLSDSDIREEVDTFMFEGHDTTTAAIAWAIRLLSIHQDVQEKALADVEAALNDSEGCITFTALNNMKYLERVIKETLRLYPSVPIMARQVREDTILGDYVVPAGCAVMIHLFQLHRNEQQFPNPEVFDPDNFLPERTLKRHPFAYIPFSAGPRNCIGQKFALLEVKTVLATILSNFHISCASKTQNTKVISEAILRPKNGVQITLRPRKSKSS